MKKAVAIRHVNFENLGILGSLLSLRGYQIDYYDAGRDDIRAINNEETDLLVVLGGPISTAQHFSGEQRYDFLDHEFALVKQRLAQRRPTLGVCLGAQVIAQALGAEVISLGVKEIGFAPLTTPPAEEESVLAPLADTPVLHWHGDMFTIPDGARCLAGTAVCPHQAFDYPGLRLSGVCARPAVPLGGGSSRYRTLADWPCLRAGTGRHRAPDPARPGRAPRRAAGTARAAGVRALAG